MVRGGAGALTVWGSPFMQQLTKCICLPQVLKTSKILHQNKSPLISGMCALKLPAEGAKRQSCPVRAQTEKRWRQGPAFCLSYFSMSFGKSSCPLCPPSSQLLEPARLTSAVPPAPFLATTFSIWLVTCLPAHPTSPALSAPGHHATPPPPNTSQTPWHCA